MKRSRPRVPAILLDPITLGEAATLAIIHEATARKAGNVHPTASFADMQWNDFLRSAIAIGPVIARASELRVGEMVLHSVEATQRATHANTNLGTLLLLAPLAKAFTLSKKRPLALSTWKKHIHQVLSELSSADAADVYQAIRLAAPGGLGKSKKHDVSSAPPADLIEAMQLAAPIDLVARQYTNDFSELLTSFVPSLQREQTRLGNSELAIRQVQILWLAQHGDSLVRRKLGEKADRELSRRATLVMNAGDPGTALFERRWNRLDTWMRSDKNRRNPGTTADLIAAALFVLQLGSPL